MQGKEEALRSIKENISTLEREVLKRLSNQEIDIKGLISKGETGACKFKSSFRFDRNEGRKNVDLELVVVKAVAGFLNTRDGKVLIGVADDETAVGLGEDLRTFENAKHQTLDFFQQHLMATLRTALSAVHRLSRGSTSSFRQLMTSTFVLRLLNPLKGR